MARPAQVGARDPAAGRVSGFRRQRAAGHGPGDRVVRAKHAARGPERSRSADGELHVRQRTAGAPLRHSEHLRQRLPSRDVRRRQPPRRPARPGKRPDDHFVRHADVAGAARQMDPRQPARDAAVAATAEYSRSQRQERRGPGVVDARADGAASRQPELRRLPQRDGSARPLARELRRRRPLARSRRVQPSHRRLGDDARRLDDVRRSDRPSPCARGAARSVHDDVHREAADLRARSGARVLRRTGGAPDYRRRVPRQRPAVLAHRRSRQKHAVSDAAIGAAADPEIRAMIIRKLALPRRTFLRGAGAALALPFLDAMVPALTAMAQTPATPPLRLGWIYVPNGVTVADWTPAATGTAYELTPSLAPLAPFRSQMLVVSGLAHRQAEAMGDGSGDHARASAVWLNGVHPKRTEGADVQAATTVDQIAAQTLGRDTLLPSLELSLEDTFMIGNCDNGYSCAYSNAIAWRTDSTPLPGEANPRVVFERMFSDAPSGSLAAHLRANRSILDSVNEEIGRLQATLGATDRAKVGQYLDAVREIERRIQRAEARFSVSDLPQPARPIGIPETVDEHARLMFDLQALALQADITRVFTFMIGREQSNTVYPASGTNEPH